MSSAAVFFLVIFSYLITENKAYDQSCDDVWDDPKINQQELIGTHLDYVLSDGIKIRCAFINKNDDNLVFVGAMFSFFSLENARIGENSVHETCGFNDDCESNQYDLSAGISQQTYLWQKERITTYRGNLLERFQTSYLTITCNQNMILDKDYVFMQFPEAFLTSTFTGQCFSVSAVNIRGHDCVNGDVGFWQASWYSLHIDSAKAICSCHSWTSDANQAGHGEDNFGRFEIINADHACSSNDKSTTDHWVGSLRAITQITDTDYDTDADEDNNVKLSNDYLWSKACSNLDESSKEVIYGGSWRDCIEQCAEFGSDCKMTNYFSYFKSADDSRCYIFDDLCKITQDANNNNDTNRSRIAYNIFEEECVNYPTEWRDNIGDSCDYYERYEWCDDNMILKNKNEFDSLIDSRYGLTAIQSCCECGGGLHIMDNVAMSYDDDWTRNGILCNSSSDIDVSLKYRRWGNLVLYSLCNYVTVGNVCDFLLDTEFRERNTSYSLFICENTEADHRNNTYDFIMEFNMNIEAKSYELYINSLWFDIDKSYYSESIDINYMNYTQCKRNILGKNNENYNVSEYYVNGVHVCYLLDTDDYAESSTDKVLIILIICFGILIVCTGICIITILIGSGKMCSNKTKSKDKKQYEMAEMAEMANNNENERGNINNCNIASAPILEGGDGGDDECIICCQNAPNMFNYPCGHVTYCNICAIPALKQNDRCPNCRVKIECKRIYNSGFRS